MQVSEHHIITLSYEVREGGPEGEMIEQMSVNYPFKFLFGTGKLLPAFEAHLEHLGEEDNFEFTLLPHQAYGQVEQENIVQIPLEVFQQSPEYRDQPVRAGEFVALTDDQGDTHNGKIIATGTDQVKVDFNHALAGKTLHFSGVILQIRKATVDELIRGAYIEDDGVRRN